ncbi:MAG: class I SAM-dependent methyltransferase, partial [Candidatus Sulfotelmatobacter sp.]
MESLDAVTREGKERLNPSLTNPNWLILRWRRQIFQKWLAKIDAPDLRVLDIGGRIQPYRSLFGTPVKHYVAIDMRPSPVVNVMARGEEIPFAGDLFDVVICTQVLEYVPEPEVFLREIRRVLKPGGFLLLSAPAVFPRDSDYDLWRFSPRSLSSLLRSFRDTEITAEGSSIVGLIRSITVCLVMLARPAFIGKLFCFTLVPLLNLLAAALESSL